MVGDAADSERNAVERADDAAEVRMEARTPRFVDERAAFFCAEDNVVFEAGVGGRHLGWVLTGKLGGCKNFVVRIVGRADPPLLPEWDLVCGGYRWLRSCLA